MGKKILVIDDSALMRRVYCDIITEDGVYTSVDVAVNGVEALQKVQQNTYDLAVLDILMPGMDGISFLKEIKKLGISLNVVVVSSITTEGADITIEALSLGAIDFLKKPRDLFDTTKGEFKQHFLDLIHAVTTNDVPDVAEVIKTPVVRKQSQTTVAKSGQVAVAIASSTGGPKALQEVIPKLPADLSAPIFLVQHMPVGFTATLAQRLDAISAVHVVEADEGMVVENGTVYIAKGGQHMLIKKQGDKHILALDDAPIREGVRPCANYMYESLMNCGFDHIVCAVLTGMGADGTEGIKNLQTQKPITVIAQNQETCTVYGMPRCVVSAGLADEIVPLDKVAHTITKNVGVIKDGCKSIS